MGWFQIGAPLRRCPEKPAIDRSMRRHGPRNARGKGGNAMLINRRQALIGSVGAAAGLTIIPAFGQVPPLKKKDSYKVGFAQTESNNPWRLAQTASMKDEAAKRGAQLVYTDAAGSAAKQVADVNSMIAQGVDFIFLPPREEKPLIPAVMNAKKAGIPVLLVDRSVDPSLAKPGVDYLAFIGSNFVLEGQRVADWTIKQTGGKGKIIELEGSVGASPANDRKKGFDETIKAKAPDMVILASQSGDFARDKGRQVAETLLQAHPDATIVYAHNDEMALGAIAAIEAAGKVPGKDILVVSIDGEKDGVQAIIDGKLGCSCECNPRFGPSAFDILYKYASGDKIPPMIINPDRFFDASNAKEVLPTAF
jgi:galactofuranose transport system substrate-binding protein